MGLEVPQWDIRVGSPSAGQLIFLLASALGQAGMAVFFGALFVGSFGLADCLGYVLMLGKVGLGCALSLVRLHLLWISGWGVGSRDPSLPSHWVERVKMSPCEKKSAFPK